MRLKQRSLPALALLGFLVFGGACSERDPAELDIARAPVDPLVFDDDFGPDVYPQAFSGTDIYAVEIDSTFVFAGSKSLKVKIPAQNSALGAFAGGVLTSAGVRDFTDFNALTFYARSTSNDTLNTAGFGNDNTGTSLYGVERANLRLSKDWTFFVIPIPSPSKLIAERGLFTYAEGWEAEHPEGGAIWFDEIRFAKLENISNPRPFMPSATLEQFIGQTVSLQGTFTVFDVNGANVRVDHQPSYFDFQISDASVARLEKDQIRVIGTGSTQVSAKLDDIAANGYVYVTGYVPPNAPAAAPTLPPQDVISVFSDAYDDVPVDSYNPYWGGSSTQLADYAIDGDNTLMYSDLNYVAIVFTSQMIDASEMSHLHVDVYAPTGSDFKVKVVAFSGPGDPNSDDEPELAFNESSTPPFLSGRWSPLEIPLEDFQLAVPWTYIGMIIFSSNDASLVLVDNVYWHQ